MHKHKIKTTLIWIFLAVVLTTFSAYGLILHPVDEIKGGTFTGDKNYTFDDFGSGKSLRFYGKIFLQNGLHTEQNVIVFSSTLVTNRTYISAPGWVETYDGNWTTPGPGAYIVTPNGSYTVTGPGASNADISYPGFYNLVPGGNLTFISWRVYLFTQGVDDFGPAGMMATTWYRNSHWYFHYNTFIKDTLYTTYLWVAQNQSKLVLNSTAIPTTSLLCKRANDSALGYCDTDLNPVTGACTCI